MGNWRKACVGRLADKLAAWSSVALAFAALLAAMPPWATSVANATASPQEAFAARAASETSPQTEPRAEAGAEPGSEPKPETKPQTPAAAAKSPPQPAVTLHVDIDLTTQRMRVTGGGNVQHVWPISSGQQGYPTPIGAFRPLRRAKMWYSRQWDDAPMPHAVFFHNGVAIHGTYATRQLGRPASHGCVRLAPSHAATLYTLVGKHGMGSTTIVVHGTPRFRGNTIARAEYDLHDEEVSRAPPYGRRYAPFPRTSRYGRRRVDAYPDYSFAPRTYPSPLWRLGRHRAPSGFPGW